MMAPGPDPAVAAPPGLFLALLLLPPRLLAAGPGTPPQPPAAAPEGPAISCVAPAPSLAWFLDGEDGGGGGGGRRLRLALRAGSLERTLRNCSAASSDEADAADASVLLEVHFQPELLQTEAPREEEQEGGDGSGALALALLVLVEAHPAARITWTDPEGRPLLPLGNASSASRFLLLGAKTYPWPPEQALRLQLQHSLRGHQAHTPNTSLPLPGLLAAHVELPLVALVVGCAGALGAFLCLGSLLGCLLCQRRRDKAAAAGTPAI